MYETVINLKPKDEWRPGVTVDSLIAEMDRALQFPGVSNAWTMPIKARIDMLSTGIRTPVGVKVFGTDLVEMEKLARQVEQVLKTVPGTSSAYAERVIGGYYLDIVPNRETLGRHGLMMGDVQDVVSTALGGDAVTTTVEGRERYTVNVRYPRDLRSNPQAIASDVLIPMPNGGTVPLGEVASVKLARGPTTIRTENGQLVVYIFVDIRDRDLGGYVAEAQKAVAASVQLPAGYYVTWSGQFEYLERAEARLKVVVPVTLLIIFLLLYLNFAGGRAVPVVVARLQPVGGGHGRLHRARWRGRGNRRGDADLSRQCAGRVQGTVRRRRPTVQAHRSSCRDHAGCGRTGAPEDDDGRGLLPIMWSTGTGSEVMQRIAVPMIGGMISSTVLTLIVIPAVYGLIKGWRLPRGGGRTAGAEPPPQAVREAEIVR
jgi:Cu(I)/Ag(I) efflux system membrane protein CusA/SilA